MLSALTYFPYFVREKTAGTRFSQHPSSNQLSRWLNHSFCQQFLPQIIKKNTFLFFLFLFIYVVILYALQNFVGKSSTVKTDDSGFTQQLLFLVLCREELLQKYQHACLGHKSNATTFIVSLKALTCPLTRATDTCWYVHFIWNLSYAYFQKIPKATYNERCIR